MDVGQSLVPVVKSEYLPPYVKSGRRVAQIEFAVLPSSGGMADAPRTTMRRIKNHEPCS